MQLLTESSFLRKDCMNLISEFRTLRDADFSWKLLSDTDSSLIMSKRPFSKASFKPVSNRFLLICDNDEGDKLWFAEAPPWRLILVD